MDFEFTNQDVIKIYGTFKKRIRECNEGLATPGFPIHPDSLNQEIEICQSITSKIEKLYPQLKAMNP